LKTTELPIKFPPSFLLMKTLATFLSAVALALALVPKQANAQTVYALRAGTDVVSFFLSRFDISAPGTVTGSALAQRIMGVNEGYIAGIEIRPATGQLYLIGYYAGTGQTQLYTLNPNTAVATPIGLPLTLSLGNDAGQIGFSFNPTTDRIRLVSANRANYQLSPTTGTLISTDGPLAYTSTDPNASQTPGVEAIGYTAGSNVMLYGIDKTYNRLVTQDVATTGTLHTVGPLGIGVATYLMDLGVGYDATTGTNTLYLMRSQYTTLNMASAELFTVSPTTGAATLVGSIGPAQTGAFTLDIAVVQTVVSATRNEAAAALGVSLAPNPATGSTGLSFVLPHASPVALEVFDALGRAVESRPVTLLAAGEHTLHWDAQHRPAGMYLLRLTVDGTTVITRRAELTR
jgi:hypothetical protein